MRTGFLIASGYVYVALLSPIFWRWGWVQVESSFDPKGGLKGACTVSNGETFDTVSNGETFENV